MKNKEMKDQQNESVPHFTVESLRLRAYPDEQRPDLLTLEARFAWHFAFLNDREGDLAEYAFGKMLRYGPGVVCIGKCDTTAKNDLSKFAIRYVPMTRIESVLGTDFADVCAIAKDCDPVREYVLVIKANNWPCVFTLALP